MDVLATYGPGEFQVLLPETDEPAAESLTHHMVDAARSSSPIRAWAGLATGSRAIQSGDAMIERARSSLQLALSRDEPLVVVREQPRVEVNDPVAEDPATQRVFALIDRVAPLDVTVLVLGETGSGKEVVAGEIHRRSSRCKGPFLCVNLAALTPTLIESELFGHERGAFTGATTRKRGYFEAAKGGTLLLDEIGELPVPLQARLLRVLEQKSVTRVGATKSVPVDVRIVAATNRDVAALVQEGGFREDLLFRLNAFTILVPPLRDRKNDIIPLAEQFISEIGEVHHRPNLRLSAEAKSMLRRYGWPGNVRELRNVVERAVILAEGDEIGQACLPEGLNVDASTQHPDGEGTLKTEMESFERQKILEVLEACGWNKAQAARELGISRRALFYKLSRFGLQRQSRS